MSNPTFLMRIAVFVSRSSSVPQCGQECHRSDRSLGTRFRQFEQCCEVPLGLTLTTLEPAFSALKGCKKVFCNNIPIFNRSIKLEIIKETFLQKNKLNSFRFIQFVGRLQSKKFSSFEKKSVSSFFFLLSEVATNIS